MDLIASLRAGGPPAGLFLFIFLRDFGIETVLVLVFCKFVFYSAWGSHITYNISQGSVFAVAGRVRAARRRRRRRVACVCVCASCVAVAPSCARRAAAYILLSTLFSHSCSHAVIYNIL
jgi:hypothetical protein